MQQNMLLIASHKGGTACTTLTAALAYGLGKLGYNVDVWDANVIDNLSLIMLDDSQNCPWPNVNYLRSKPKSGKQDIILVDGPPLTDPACQELLEQSSAVLLTTLIDALSIRTLDNAISACMSARKANPKLKFLGLSPQKFEADNELQGQLLAPLKAKKGLIYGAPIPRESEVSNWPLKPGTALSPGQFYEALKRLIKHLEADLPWLTENKRRSVLSTAAPSFNIFAEETPTENKAAAKTPKANESMTPAAGPVSVAKNSQGQATASKKPAIKNTSLKNTAVTKTPTAPAVSTASQNPTRDRLNPFAASPKATAKADSVEGSATKTRNEPRLQPSSEGIRIGAARKPNLSKDTVAFNLNNLETPITKRQQTTKATPIPESYQCSQCDVEVRPVDLAMQRATLVNGKILCMSCKIGERPLASVAIREAVADIEQNPRPKVVTAHKKNPKTTKSLIRRIFGFMLND